MAMLAPMFGGQQPKFAPGSGMDDSLAAILVGSGMLPKRRDTRNQYMLPGQQQGGSGLDGQTFQGLDALHAMQKGRSDRYSRPTFSTPGKPAPLLPSAKLNSQFGERQAGPGAMPQQQQSSLPTMPGSAPFQNPYQQQDMGGVLPSLNSPPPMTSAGVPFGMQAPGMSTKMPDASKLAQLLQSMSGKLPQRGRIF